jgi:hypothetical protein
LVISKFFGGKLDISWLVDTVDISESGSDGEHVTDLGESLVDRKDLFGAGVELFGVDIFVVDTILFSSSDTDFHFQPDLHGSHALEIFDTDGNVLLIGFFRKVEHVRREKGFAVLVEEIFVGLEHAIEPGKKLLGAVIRVENDWDSVVLGNGTDVHGKGDRSGGRAVGVLDSLSAHEGTSSVGTLDDDGALGLAGSFQDGIGRRGTVGVK